MSWSGWRTATSAADVDAVGERELDRGRVVDDVQGGEDVAGRVDDDARAEAVLRLALGVEAVRLDQDERRLDGGVDELRASRGRRLRRERLGDGVLDVRRGELVRAREQGAVQRDGEERGQDARDERRPPPDASADPGDTPRRWPGIPDVEHWSTYVGQGAVRFYLPLNVQLPNDFFAQAVVVTKGLAERERVKAKLEKALANEFPSLTAASTRWSSARRWAGRCSTV